VILEMSNNKMKGRVKVSSLKDKGSRDENTSISRKDKKRNSSLKI